MSGQHAALAEKAQSPAGRPGRGTALPGNLAASTGMPACTACDAETPCPACTSGRADTLFRSPVASGAPLAATGGGALSRLPISQPHDAAERAADRAAEHDRSGTQGAGAPAGPSPLAQQIAPGSPP